MSFKTKSKPMISEGVDEEPLEGKHKCKKTMKVMKFLTEPQFIPPAKATKLVDGII